MDHDELLKPKEKCTKIINVNKYERTNPEIQEWWWRKFKGMEDRNTRPFYKRLKYLQDCFSKEELQDLISAGVEIFPELQEDIVTFKPESGLVKKPSKSILVPKKKKTKKISLEPEPAYTNPYLNFMKKSPEDAQVWRPKRPPTLDELHIVEKAKHLENQIASDFDEWFQQVGSNIKSEIDKETILTIFELLFSYPIATALARSMREIGAVPEKTAKFLEFPQKSESAGVRRQIRRDIRAGIQKPQTIAFNKTLPPDLRRKPFTENLKAKWFEYEIRHQDLATMAAVWRGITELHSTRTFCKWLLEHPYIPPPPFLEKEGLLDSNKLSKNVLDVPDSEIAEWDVQHPTEASIIPGRG